MLLLVPWLAGIGAVLIWVLIPALIKISASQMDETALLVLRFVVSSLLYFPILWRSLHKAKRISRRNWCIGALLLSANFGLQTYAILVTPITLYGAIFAAGPILTLIAFSQDRSRLPWIGMMLASLGMIVMVGGSSNTGITLFGVLATLGGLIAWIGVTGWMMDRQNDLSAAELSAWMQPAGLVSVLPFWLMRGTPHSFENSALIPVVVIGAVVPLSFYLFSTALRRDARIGILSQYLEPLFAAACGTMLFQERWGLAESVGTFLILSGVWKSTSLAESTENLV